MKNLKPLFKKEFRLLTLILCLAMAVPQLHADIIVAGSNSSLFGGSWTTSTNTSNKMTQYSGNYYYLAKANVSLSGETQYKVVDNGNWYGDNGNNISFTANGTYSIVFVYNTSSHKVRHIGSFQSIVIAGADTQALGSSWNGSDTNNQMTTSDGITYTLTKNVTYSGSASYGFKTVVDGAWYGDAGDANIYYSIPEAGDYEVTFTFNAVTGMSSVSAIKANVPTYDYTFYVYLPNGGTPYLYLWNGSNNPNGGWPGTQMTVTERLDDGHDWYKMTVTCEFSTLNAIVDLGNGANQSADINNLTPDTCYITWDGGNRTPADVSTDAPTAPAAPDYYVVGDNTLIGHDWAIANDTQMTEDNGIYTWSKNGIHLTAGNYGLKVLDSNNTWYGDSVGNNIIVTAGANGTYRLEVTFNPTTRVIQATLTMTEEDPTYTYDIYVRYEGTQPIGNVYAYTFDTYGVHHLGDWGGTTLTALTPVVINGYTYYHTTITSYDPQAKAIFNENQSSSTQTANLDLQVGDNYFTYGGGSTVDGPNDDPDPRMPMYLIGHANSQQWAANAGIPMEWVDSVGYYKLENVVLTSMSNFAFATQLGSSSSDWATLNAHRLSSRGDNNFAVTESMFGTWIDYLNYASENHNWYVEQAGAYDIYVNPSTRKIMLTPCNENMYISFGVNWTYQDNSVQMTTVDGNVYQTTITLNNGDYFLFSTHLTDESAWGATTPGYEISDIMIGFAQRLAKDSINNFHFTGTTGKYIVVVNKLNKTVILRRTADATVTKVFLQKTSNVTLDPAGGTYNHQTLEGKRGGIYAWNKLNLEAQQGQTYTYAAGKGPTNYTYQGEVGNNYSGDDRLKDLPDTITADGKQWYAWSIGNSICEFYFIRNNQQDYLSQKVIRRAGEVWLTWIDEDATSNRQDNAQHLDSLLDVTRDYYDVSASGVSDCATMLEGHYYVYYTNTTGWDSVYCYAWSENPFIEFTNEYPGTKCTFVGYDEDGYEVWCYDFGLIDQFEYEPTNVIFDNGRGGASEGAEGDSYRQQTGDLVFDNGACYDYLGMIYLGNSLNAIINGGIVNGPKYTVEDDLVGVYYDDNAITKIAAFDKNGQEVDYYVKGALYAKDLENYTAKSRMADGTTDYVYDICAHTPTATYPGGSQIQLKRTYYDQSNWVKIVLSPNFDNANAKSNGDVTIAADQFDTMDYDHAKDLEEGYLKRYVGKIIPGHSMSGNLVNNVNPQMHITNIAYPIATEKYEENVYVTAHFNDSIVFSYVHQDWCPGIYEGVYRTVPHLATNDHNQTYVDYTVVDSTVLYKMFYVAPKPQEVAYITWAVFDHPNPNGNIGTTSCLSEPSEPGAFYAPMNWNRRGQLWDGTDPNDPYGAWGTTYGPYSNGYMQYGAFQVNWSLFEDMEINPQDPNRGQLPWYQIFKPGQAYKILAIIRYAHGDKAEDVEYTPGVYSGSGYNEGSGNHVANAPLRDNFKWEDMQHTPYRDLAQSKFIVFPLKGSSENSNGNDIGNVTTVQEVQVERTVVAVHYYNLMGMRSDKPFDGLNIVVTTYSDGSRSSKKILR